MKSHLAISLFCLVLSGSALASEVHYRESIDGESTSRITRSFEDSIVTLWESNLPGDSRFGQPLDSITFYHSIEAIDPPLMPYGMIRLLRLKLHLRNRRNRDLTLTVDSIGLGKVHRRHFLIGPDSDDWLNVYETTLADGQIIITLKAGAGKDDIDDTDDGDDDEMSGLTLDGELAPGRSLCPTPRPFVLKRSVMDVVYMAAIPMDVSDSRSTMPDDHFLSANYPNPFNPSTTIEYNLPTRSHVRVEVLNALGRTVRVLTDAPVSAGRHRVVWDGHSLDGTPVASGVYYYRIVAGELINTRKMILLK